MSRQRVLGFSILAVGAVIAFLLDNDVGMALGCVCVILGLVVIVSSEAQGLVSKSGSNSSSVNRKQAKVLVLVKEVHACPDRGATVTRQKAKDQLKTDLSVHVFIHCWLLNETELPLRLAEPQLTLKVVPLHVTKSGERIRDLNNWCLIKEEAEGSDWSEGEVRTTQVKIVELDSSIPLECGNPREGWLHFRISNTTHAELTTGSLVVSVRDSRSDVHIGVASRVQMPGRISPNSGQSTSINQEATSETDELTVSRPNKSDER